MNYIFAFLKFSFYLCALIFIHLHNMKKLVLFTLLSVALISCTGNNKEQQVETIFELDDLMLVADQKVNDTISVVGYVTHTCKESGKKCFIVGESQEISLQVLAGGEISGFDGELVGSKLQINGIIKESQLSQEAIAEMEKGVQEKIEGGESEESCAAEMSNIEDMRKWMEAHNKDYYVTYYMEGLSFKKLELK